MQDDRSVSLPFVISMHLTAFLGLLLCWALGLGLIHEYIQAFVEELDSLSPLARFMYHFLEELSCIALVLFVPLIVISESLVHGENRFLDTFPLLFGICLLMLLALTITLVITDLHRIQSVSPIISGASPFISAIVVSMSINMLGVCSTLSYNSSRKTSFAVIFFLAPLPAFVPLMAMFPAEKLISEYGIDPPISYPRLLWVSIATAIILAAFVCTLLLTRGRAKQSARQTALFSFGTFSYFLSFVICGTTILPHLIMLMVMNGEKHFRNLKNTLFVALAILWLLTALVQTIRFLVRRRKRKEISSAESSR